LRISNLTCTATSRALKWLGQHAAAADVITKCRERYKTVGLYNLKSVDP
jgi:hypothetical protein